MPPLIEGPGHRRRHMSGEIGSQTGHLFDECGGDIGVLKLRREKDGLAAFEEFTVHQGHLKFIFKVGKGPESPENGIGFKLFDSVDQKSFKSDDFHIGHPGAAFHDQFPAFLKCEERIFAGVDGHCHHNFVKKTSGPFHQIQMSVGVWIERSGIYYGFHRIYLLTGM
jgi:hypothetical protein